MTTEVSFTRREGDQEYMVPIRLETLDHLRDPAALEDILRRVESAFAGAMDCPNGIHDMVAWDKDKVCRNCSEVIYG